jgi:hypothetical protein
MNAVLKPEVRLEPLTEALFDDVLRIGSGAEVRTDASGRAVLGLDHGERLLLDHDSRVHVGDDGAVTLDEVNAALRKRLKVRDLVLSVVCTASELRDPLEAAVPHLRGTTVLPFDAD